MRKMEEHFKLEMCGLRKRALALCLCHPMSLTLHHVSLPRHFNTKKIHVIEHRIIDLEHFLSPVSSSKLIVVFSGVDESGFNLVTVRSHNIRDEISTQNTKRKIGLWILKRKLTSDFFTANISCKISNDCSRLYGSWS